MNSIIEKLLELISKAESKIESGEIGKALKLLKGTPDLPDPDQLMLSLLSRWNAAEREMLDALITDNDYDVEKAKITKRLLTFLAEVKTRIKQEQESKTNQAADGVIELPDYDGKPQILLLYAKEDVEDWQQLKRHLFLSLRDEELQFIDMQEAVPLGTADVFAYQEKLVAAARTVLVLVTPNVLSYPVFPLAELALNAQKLIPIRVREIELEGTPFDATIKGLPGDGRFIDQWESANSAWVDVAKTLRSFFESLKK